MAAMTDVSVHTDLLASERARGPTRFSGQSIVVGVAGALLIAGACALVLTQSWRQGALFLLGGALGLTLYHALFGFTAAWRVFIADGRGAGLRAQMLMLALAAALFYPALAGGTLLGHPVQGLYGSIGVSLIVGAILFGVGMQLAGGCASGTLYTVGGGSTRMLVVLGAFIGGSVLGAYHFSWWAAQPNIGAVNLIAAFGWRPALAATLALLGAIALVTVLVERRRHGRLTADAPAEERGIRRLLRGPWPLVAGAVALALGNFATLALAGHPWGITSAFALWGSKALDAMGGEVAWWDYWQSRAHVLEQSVFADVTSVMNFGIILGALFSAGLARKFAPTLKVPLRSLLAALLGGLMMGYGARLAYGCNIGAYFSGVASASLHGWLWFVLAFFGSIVGIWLRPLFGLPVERTRAGGC
jgi:uncharacterized membrane protein YedE/YeeE